MKLWSYRRHLLLDSGSDLRFACPKETYCYKFSECISGLVVRGFSNYRSCSSLLVNPLKSCFGTSYRDADTAHLIHLPTYNYKYLAILFIDTGL